MSANFVEDIKVVRNAAKHLPCICGETSLSMKPPNFHSGCLQHNSLHAIRRIEKHLGNEIKRQVAKARN